MKKRSLIVAIVTIAMLATGFSSALAQDTPEYDWYWVSLGDIVSGLTADELNGGSLSAPYTGEWGTDIDEWQSRGMIYTYPNPVTGGWSKVDLGFCLENFQRPASDQLWDTIVVMCYTTNPGLISSAQLASVYDATMGEHVRRAFPWRQLVYAEGCNVCPICDTAAAAEEDPPQCLDCVCTCPTCPTTTATTTVTQEVVECPACP